jgi:hypothetical protein
MYSKVQYIQVVQGATGDKGLGGNCGSQRVKAVPYWRRSLKMDISMARARCTVLLLQLLANVNGCNAPGFLGMFHHGLHRSHHPAGFKTRRSQRRQPRARFQWTCF